MSECQKTLKESWLVIKYLARRWFVLCKTSVFVAPLLLISPGLGAQQELFCPAESDENSLDTSCAVDYLSIKNTFDQYQVVDTRTDSSSPLKGGWRIPVSSFRFKNFLKSMPLLVVGDVFSKRAIADVCSVGQKLGLNIKVAVGQGWPEPIQNLLYSRVFVSAEEVFFEYHLGDVTLVAGSVNISEKLNLMGLKNHVVESDYFAFKRNRFSLAALNSDVPSVVFIEEKIQSLDHTVSGVYTIDGGIESLGIYYRDMKRSQAGKVNADKNKAMCAAL